jgi:signal transduction histidine kinase
LSSALDGRDAAAAWARQRPPRSRTALQWTLWSLALASAYVLAGRLGLMLDAVSGFATLVWAPTGLSLAALTLLGLEIWGGVALGALTVNLMAGAHPLVAAGIAVGNTLEALVGAYLLRKLDFRPDLGRLRDVVLLIGVAVPLAPLLSASIGVLSLVLGGVVESSSLPITWTAWWLGDAIGALVVTPLILTWRFSERRAHHSRAREALLAALTLAAAAGFIFLGSPPRGALFSMQWPYVLVAPLLWVALRFGVRGTATATFLVSAVAVAATILSRGPFGGTFLYERLFSLQAFIGFMAVTFLILASLATERAHTERRLRHAKEEAESSSRAKSRFLAVMSHELRTPLTSIIGFSDLLDAEVKGPLNQAQKGQLARIRAAAWHLVSIIDGILAFSRVEAGREHAEAEPVDVAALADEVVALLEPQAAAKGLELERNGAASIILSTDAGKLRQVLLNLVGNAVKFSVRGRIDVQVSVENGSVRFQVRDEGPGIPSDQLEAIFEPFGQFRHDQSVLSSGTGLGLSVAAMLARLLGGGISVASELGRGSTFTLTLPVMQSGPSSKRGSAEEGGSPRSE